MRALRRLVRTSLPDELVFRSRSGGPFLETTILNQGLHPALKARSTEGRIGRISTGLQPAMGTHWNQPHRHPAPDRTHFAAHDRAVQWRNPVRPSPGSMFLQDWQSKCSFGKYGKMSLRRKCLKSMERPIGIEPTPEPWQGSVLPLY